MGAAEQQKFSQYPYQYGDGLRGAALAQTRNGNDELITPIAFWELDAATGLYMPPGMSSNPRKPRVEATLTGQNVDDRRKSLRTIAYNPSPYPDRLQNIAWTWHSFPQAVYSSQAKKIFVGGAGRARDQILYSYDLSTGDVESVTIESGLGGDDHNAVVPVDLPWDEKLMVLYVGHSNNNYIGVRFTDNYDVTTLGPETQIAATGGVTYINVHHGFSTDTIYVISRVAGVGWCVWYSDDHGATWSSQQTLVKSGYLDTGKRRRGHANLGIAMSRTSESDDNIYYVHLDRDGNVCKMDGTVLGNVRTGSGLPINPSDGDLVYDATTAGHKAIVTSVLGGQGSLSPMVTFATLEDPSACKYHVAYYDTDTNSFADVVVIDDAGGPLTEGTHPHYIGSLALVGYSRVNRCEIVASIEVNGSWEIWYYFTYDVPGNKWNKQRLASSDTKKLFRPIRVAEFFGSDSLDVPPVLWLSGYYMAYNNYYVDAVFPFDMREL